MITGIATATKLQDILTLTNELSASERNRLKELLNRPEDAPLPTCATIDEAIELYLAQACGLSRAAALAGVTRWTLMDRMKERDLYLYSPDVETVEDMDAMAAQLRQKGYL